MHYLAVVKKDGQRTTIDFPGCPGCATFAEPSESVSAVAQEALEGWLKAHLIDGESPPEPRVRVAAPKGSRVLPVSVSPSLTARLQIRWARETAGISQAQLAKRVGVPRQQISRLEATDGNLTLGTLERVAKALGQHWSIQLSQ